MALINWIVSPAAQQAIADFTINGKQLFVPVHLATEVQAD
jgi:ABC-type tungstate transport system permease subunit